MADSLSRSDLATRLASITSAHGVTITASDERTLAGTKEAITSKWFLGGRKVVYRMSCDFDDASRAVRFREAVRESSWGVPPPGFSVETTTQKGTRVSASRTDRSVGGGGKLDYGDLRAAFEQAAAAGGWQIKVELGKMP
jgi:hypothetical protein